MYRSLTSIAGAAILIVLADVSIAQNPTTPAASDWEKLPINDLADCFGMALVISQRVGSPPIGDGTVEDCKKQTASCMFIWSLQKQDALFALCHISEKVMSVRRVPGFFNR
jgi:hypothetical protein